MAKIPKGLGDKDMFKGYAEKETFETMFLSADEEPKPVIKNKKTLKEDLNTAYLTKDLQEKIGKLLLDLKMDLYKEGIIDYEIKVKKIGMDIVLSAAVPKSKERI